MASRPRNLRLALAALVLAQSGCDAAPEEPLQAAVEEAKPRLGLMTSLPLYWPRGAGLAELVGGEDQLPWQRAAFESRHVLVPLDTLSPIPALSPDAPETDPLDGLQRLAIIQPRGLSPADNVALDEWVRAGGQLLLVLDPMLTGEYEFPLGDPRRPTEVALVPPVVARWGLAMRFDEAQTASRAVEIGGRALEVELAGAIREIAGSDTQCRIEGEGALASCTIGEGQVTLFADAAILEGADPREGDSEAIAWLIGRAFGGDGA